MQVHPTVLTIAEKLKKFWSLDCATSDGPFLRSIAHLENTERERERFIN